MICNPEAHFDLWADDVSAFPAEVRDGAVRVDVETLGDREAQAKERLQAGLERNLSFVIGKSAIFLEERGCTLEIIEAGLRIGSQYRLEGWCQGLTILGCMVNLLLNLGRSPRPMALFHGLAAVAAENAGAPYRYNVKLLPLDVKDLQLLHSWFRQFIEIRDAEGSETCLISAIHAGADGPFLMDMLGSAATDRRYIDKGHPLDFTNKAFQILDCSGWPDAELVLTSLVPTMAISRRREESNTWRSSFELVKLLNETFPQLEEVLESGGARREERNGDPELVETILSAGPQDLVARMLEVLQAGTLKPRASPGSKPATRFPTGTQPCIPLHSPMPFSRPTSEPMSLLCCGACLMPP